MKKGKDIITVTGVTPEHIDIKDMVYTIRGQQVMLDFHIAGLYHVETRTLKQAVKRNLKRFPPDFMFIISQNEANTLLSIGVSQNVIPPDYNFGATSPMVFTEQGVAMLSSVLRSKIAVEVNIEIMRAFVAARNFAENLRKEKANTNPDRTFLYNAFAVLRPSTPDKKYPLILNFLTTKGCFFSKIQPVIKLYGGFHRDGEPGCLFETMAAAQTAQKEINALGFNYEIPLLSVNLTCTYALKELGLWSGFKKMNNLTEKLYESN